MNFEINKIVENKYFESNPDLKELLNTEPDILNLSEFLGSIPKNSKKILPYLFALDKTINITDKTIN
jgi:hypothetical protein